MEILRTPREMHQWGRDHSRNSSRGFVPTMGALHRGHEALLQHCRKQNDQAVLSLFVNPTQFNVESDFEKYPRTIERDLSIAEHHGIDAVYLPTSESMYSQNFRSFIEPGSAADSMEGAGRPGHFRGVTTVVAKLFHAVMPHTSYFGKKDFQQLAVIRQMVHELDFDIKIIGVDTVRDDDGLALSSRNQRLSPHARRDSAIIYESLRAVQTRFQNGERQCSVLLDTFRAQFATSQLATLEYAVISDATHLQEIETISQPAVLCVAAWYDDVRLIDNIELTPN